MKAVFPLSPTIDIVFVACPTSCRCTTVGTSNRLFVNCEGVGLNTIPSVLPGSAVEIDLSRNRVEVQEDSFKNCTNVTTLNLAHNNIKVIRKSMFSDMLKLEKIALDENHLEYNSYSFPDHSFQNLRYLTSVRLQSSFLQDSLSLANFTATLKKLPATLEELFVNIPCCSDEFAATLATFKNLRKLSMLDLCFRVLSEDTFRALKDISIRELKIKIENIHGIHPLTFSHFSKLKTLDMSETNGLSLADLHPAWIGLQYTEIENLILAMVYRQPFQKEFVELNATFFKHFDLPNLINLDISATKLDCIDDKDKHFLGLVKPQTLNLSFNFFSHHDFFFLFNDYLQYLDNLVELDVSYQTDSLQTTTTDASFRLPPNLSRLNMSSIKPPADNEPIRFHLDNPTNIQYFRYQYNNVPFLSVFDISQPNASIPFEADFSCNNMKSFTGAFNHTSMVSKLRVGSLILHENWLGEELGRKWRRNFQRFERSENFGFSFESNKNLAYSTLENQHELEFLDLSKNSLSQINFKISHMTKIRTIDVSENLLSQFDKTFQDIIDSLKSRSPNFTMNMLGNPIQCSCETLQYLWWMYRKQSMFTRYEDYTCLHENEQIQFTNMKKLLDKLDYRCSLDLVVKVSAGLLVFIILVAIISFFLYRHKWDVRFFCLKFITDRKAYQELKESVVEYEYDAFVAYHKNDLAWVRNELHQNLDKRIVNWKPMISLVFDFAFMIETSFQATQSRKIFYERSSPAGKQLWC